MFSWIFGVVYAVADWLLMRLVTARAIANPQKSAALLTAGLAGRYLLTVAVLALALLIPDINAVAVVVPLIVQKAAVVLLAFVPERKQKK